MQHNLIKILKHNYIELSGVFFVVYLCKIRVYFVENIVYGTSQNLKWLVERLGNAAEEKRFTEKDIKRHTTSNLSPGSSSQGYTPNRNNNSWYTINEADINSG